MKKNKKPRKWSRKGRCPSCNVSTGSNHSKDCKFDYRLEDYTNIRIRRPIYNQMQKVRGVEKWDTFLMNCIKTYTKSNNIPLETLEIEIDQAIRRIIKKYKDK